MLIRHDPHLSRGRVLMPVPRSEWMPPSRAQQKTVFGDEDRTKFRLRARAHDGHVTWAGWFEDRDDADAFLEALVSGSLLHERGLWRLPSVEWHPGIGTDLTFEVMAQTILTTTGSNQTYTSPQDWNNSNNQIECLGGGAGGGISNGTTSRHATGGGAGAYSAITNFSFASPGTTTATYRVGAGATLVSRTSGGTGATAGNNGEPTWFNNTTDPGVGTDNTKCSAAGGTGGVSGAGSRNGGAGGATTASWGQTKNAGGRGGNLTGASGSGGSGGGGAAGPAGAGGAGTDNATTTEDVRTNGGSANNGTTAGASAGNNTGNAGTEFSASYGCGSGGGGNATATGPVTAGGGGNYGGGGGGASTRGSNTVNGGAGIQGLVIVEWTPVSLLFDPQPFLHILVR